jgi:VanZ family protein
MNTSLIQLERTLIPWLPYIFGLWMLLAVYLTLAPPELLSSAAKAGSPELGHVILFGGWTLLFGSLILANTRRKISIFTIVLTGIIFGACIEVLQIFMPFSRTGSWADIGFNTVGAVSAGCFIYIYKYKLRKKKAKKQR